MSRPKRRHLWLDIVAVLLAVLAAFWAGSPGVAIYLVGLLVGGIGFAYNDRTLP